MIKCSSCGANVSRRDEACSYCGTDNPGYCPPDRETSLFVAQGMDAFRSENYATAVHFFNQAVDLDPDLFDAYFYMAASYSTLKQPQAAIQSMEKAQTLRPGCAPIAYNLGMLYKQVGSKAAAQKYLEKALALAETDPAIKDKKEFKQRINDQLKEYKRWKLF